jgi:hypothetical protein
VRLESTVAPVPRVDRALGAALTLAAATFVAFVAVVLLAPDATTASESLAFPAAIGVVVGAAATAWLLLDGYDRFGVPVEGRRWVVELAAFGAAFATAQLVVDAVTALPAWSLLVAALGALYASSRLGRTVADARDWYDRDAYYRNA